MKCNGRRCDGFTTFGVLSGLTVLSVAVAVCVKWCVFKKHQLSVLRQKQHLVPCAEAFLLFVREQPNVISCVGTRYAVRNASDGVFGFVRKPPGKYDFEITVENNAWATEKTARFGIAPQGITEEHIDEPQKKPKFLIVRFYARHKTHCLHTCFVPVTAKKDKHEALVPEPVEHFILTPKTEKSLNTENK